MVDKNTESTHPSPEQAAHQIAIGMAAQAYAGLRNFNDKFGFWTQTELDIRLTEQSTNPTPVEAYVHAIAKKAGVKSDEPSKDPTYVARFDKSLENDPIVQKLLPVLVLEELSRRIGSPSNAIDGDTLCTCEPDPDKDHPNSFESWLWQQGKSHFKDVAQNASRDPRVLMNKSELNSLLDEGHAAWSRSNVSENLDLLSYLQKNFSKIHPANDGQGITQADLIRYSMDNAQTPNFNLETVKAIRENFEALRKYNTSDGTPTLWSFGFAHGNADGITQSDITDGKAQLAAEIKAKDDKIKQFAQKHGF